MLLINVMLKICYKYVNNYFNLKLNIYIKYNGWCFIC